MTTALSNSPDPGSLTWTEGPDSGPQNRLWMLSGILEVNRVVALDRELRSKLPSSGGSLTLNLAQVAQIDSIGTAFLVELWRMGKVSGFTVALDQVAPEVQSWLELYRVVEDLPALPDKVGGLEALGGRVYESKEALIDFVVLASDVTIGSIVAAARPWKLRWSAVIDEASRMGSQAFGIVGLIVFLVGFTLAFQSAYQLRQFGAAIYVATLTAISVVREMGPLITAILVAGRSGSSITSEVATMKVNEEIDAMKVMGIPFVEYVAVPKLLAMVTMVPLLTMMADVLGIAGGWLVSISYLDLTSGPYMRATIDALVLKDLLIGLFKSFTFAWGIGLIGLYYGLQVTGGAQEVGRATTNSVVSGIFFIIIADSLYSILFYVVLA